MQHRDVENDETAYDNYIGSNSNRPKTELCLHIRMPPADEQMLSGLTSKFSGDGRSDEGAQFGVRCNAC